MCPSALLDEKRGRFTASEESVGHRAHGKLRSHPESVGRRDSLELSLEHRKLGRAVPGQSIAQVCQVTYVGTAVSKLRRLCRSFRLLLYRAMSSRAEGAGADGSRVPSVSSSSSSGCPSCSRGTAITGDG